MDGVKERKKSKQDLLNLILPMGGINAWVTFPELGYLVSLGQTRYSVWK